MNRRFSAGACAAMLVTVILAGCTSDPYAPVNQSAPIRQMDNAFDPSGSRYYERTTPRPADRYPRSGYAPPSYSRY